MGKVQKKSDANLQLPAAGQQGENLILSAMIYKVSLSRKISEPKSPGFLWKFTQ